MDIKTKHQETIRSRYLIYKELYADIFYSLHDAQDSQSNQRVFILKFHPQLVSPEFVDYCTQQLSEYLYQALPNSFELVDYEFNGKNFYIIYKSPSYNIVSLDSYLNQVNKRPDSSKRRYRVLLKLSKLLYEIEKKQWVFGGFSLNNIFITEQEDVILGPAKLQLICFSYFVSKIDIYEDSIFLAPEFLKTFESNTQTDIYGFGVLAFYLVTSQWPYDNKCSVIKLKQWFQEGPKDPKVCNPKINDKLNYFILKSLQYNLKQRWSSFRIISDILIGKEVEKFDQLSNQKNTSELFLNEVTDHQKKAANQWLGYVLNLGLIIGLIWFGYSMYHAYFGQYNTVKVPNVVDVPLNKGIESLSQLKLKPTVEGYYFHPEVQEGHIIRIEPVSGRAIKEGRHVKVFVSKGKQEVLVPSITGRSLKDIAFILEGTNITIKQREPEYSTTVEEGLVISQVPLAGQYIYDSGSVEITLSKGSPVLIDVISDVDEFFVKIQVFFEFTNDKESYQFSVIEKAQKDTMDTLYSDIHFSEDTFSEQFVVHRDSHIVVTLDNTLLYQQPVQSNGNE
jgi:hypothetical protein